MSSLLATAKTAKSGTTVTAIVNGITTTVQVARDLSVAAGDILLVERVGAQWFAYAAVFTVPAGPAPVPVEDENQTPPPPKPVITTGSLVVSPVETRSYRNGTWRTDNDDVYQGQYGGWGNHTGCVFYGTKPASLVGATVTSAVINVKRVSAGVYAAQPTTMRLVTEKTRPTGAPTLGSSTAGPSLAVGSSATFTIPTSWAQAMVNGTAGGLAFYDATGSPYVRFAGRGSWSPAFTMTIAWQRG
ncbi:hypothetical protein [Micromonospora mirobrigensis]|uniref:Uncharacterized protein n=1 Tax=Micromonospora mirobrigensis TaxID=262898 RepID=A0A1C4XDQ3_9ACTN|nr:hypothetical protein [Micromonospora mirobrigensis]SCF06670.1 hypothetical protein GA0070564_10322 [Micromonospora mirobrigensis]